MMSLSRNRRQWWAAAGIVVGGLLPTLGFIPFLYQDYSTVADRYMYLPMLGVSLALAGWMTRHWSLATVAACGFLLGAFGRASLLQAGYWHDDLAVYQHGLEVNPNSYAAEYSLAGVFRERGQTLAAESYYRAALRLNPKYARADNDLGATLLLQGRTQEAIEHFRRVPLRILITAKPTTDWATPWLNPVSRRLRPRNMKKPCKSIPARPKPI